MEHLKRPVKSPVEASRMDFSAHAEAFVKLDFLYIKGAIKIIL